jgi:hypothetical protein
MSDTLNKRTHPCGEEKGEFGNKDCKLNKFIFLYSFLIFKCTDTKKRDQKDSHRVGDTRSGKGSAVKGGKLDPGDYKNFPMIPEKSVQVMKQKGYRALFPIQ